MTKPRGSTQSIIDRIDHYSHRVSVDELGGPFDKGKFGACLGILDGLTQGRRYELLEILYPNMDWGEKVSTKRMSTPEMIALIKWVDPGKATQTSPWTGHISLRTEIDIMFKEVGKPIQLPIAEGQEHLSTAVSDERLRDHFVDKYQGIPKMVCGCSATGKTITGEPFCKKHGFRENGTQNSDGYIVREIVPVDKQIIEELGYG